MTLIDPFSPTFEDYDLYDPQQFEPLPDVFDPADWSIEPMTGPATPDSNTDADRLAAFVASLRATYSSGQAPPDGAIILVDEDTAWVRSDEHADSEQHGGDWYRLDGRDDVVPTTLGEILDAGPRAVDDPPARRRSYERLYTAEDIARLADAFTRDGAG